MNLETIIRKCRAREPKAQKALYDRFATAMYRLCYRYLKEQPTAEDAMIRGFNNVFDHIDRFDYRSDAGVSAWIKRIMVNESLMELRKRTNFHLREELTDNTAENAPEVLADLAAENLYELIRQLPAGYRTVFNLYVIEGYTHPEIAELLGISENTSKSQLSKARKALQRQLQPNGHAATS